MKASDLTLLRKVSIFGCDMIIPKDTSCCVHFKLDLGRYRDTSIGWITFEIVVQLQHSHFGQEGNKVTWKVCASTKDTPWLKRAFTHNLLSTKDTVLSHPTYFKEAVLDSQSWKEANKKFKEQKIRSSIIEMFLEGEVPYTPLLKYLPKTHWRVAE